MDVILYISEAFNLMDMTVPYDLFRKMDEISVKVVGLTKGMVKSEDGISVQVPYGIEDIHHADLLWVCGGDLHSDLFEDQALHKWLKEMSQLSKMAVGVASGSYLLAKAGVLSDVKCTTHPKYHRKLKKLGIPAVKNEFCHDLRYMTTATHGYHYKLVYDCIKTLVDEKTAKEVMPWSGDGPERVFSASDYPEKWSRIKSRQKHFEKHLRKCLNDKIGKSKNNKVVASYLYEGARAIDFVSSFNILKHSCQTTIVSVGNTKGLVKVEGGGFAIKVDHALQEVKRAYMLLVPGGSRIKEQLSNTYLIHWLANICPTTFRILTIGEGEQIIGVSGVLTEFDPFVEEEMDLLGSKYMMVGSFAKSQDLLLKLLKENHQEVAKNVSFFGAYGKGMY
ncbi:MULTISPECIES: DJ-1/PfpI family protein [unclassified Fusibacter]|uniref:DJ-1/PfpI family protein n=1 Tax=unclassified Fusibacter TaxID=2624464 RepID=UPI0010107DBC|nr:MULTISPECIES: DJ-1/PfpI family protein [unclassified Fusibacter]MCK8060939.1 DJ-1/PfpI family protein [Fusibacter sp. A2]NPE23235.1 hypothetical protein [Fusibacter sp. A1]RXV59589.1 hypothetical protein DWB64_15495 [Fusibacter sp. A1]